jgi:hypothetical protein
LLASVREFSGCEIRRAIPARALNLPVPVGMAAPLSGKLHLQHRPRRVRAKIRAPRPTIPLHSRMVREGAVSESFFMTDTSMTDTSMTDTSMTDASMPDTGASALQSLDARLVKPSHKGPTHVAGRFAFRGDILLTDAPAPALTAAIAASDAGRPGLAFLAGQLETFSQLPVLAAALNGALVAGGKYFIYVADVKRGDRYQIDFGDARLYVLPYDDVSVYNELIDFFYLDKTKMKKFDTAAKIDALAEGAAKYCESFPNLTYEEGLARV